MPHGRKARPGSLWSRVDERRETKRETLRPAAEPPPRRPKFRWVVEAILPLTLLAAAGVAVSLPESLAFEARMALFGFAFATVLWSTTKLNSAYVALVAVMLTIFMGGASQEELFDSLASDVVWLMIGAFVLGGAMRLTGLAGRLTGLVVKRAKTVRGVFWMITTVLIPLSFFIPSTSGRAAVVMPVFNSISESAGDKKITRALALLMPTVILVATISTLIGAGSHLIAIDLLDEISGESISFAQWAMWGVPFGAAASYISCGVIMKMFLDKGRPDREFRQKRRDAGEAAPFSRNEKVTLFVLLAMGGLWLTEALHGVEIATVTVAGALLLTLPVVGVMKWKDGLKAVSWNLIIFVGAALALGNALIKSGAAQWIIDNLFALSGITGIESTFLILLVIGFISLTSHIYMTSHAARAVALVPPFLYLAGSLDLNATAVLFISTLGMDYCQTFPVSSKALLMFQEQETETFQPADLLRLSAVLLIVHIALVVVFYYGYWQWTGLAL